MQPFDHYSVELQHAATAREPTVVDYTRDGMSDLAVRERERLQVEIVLYVPIMLKDRLLGVVTIDEPRSYLPFSARDIELAAALASQELSRSRTPGSTKRRPPRRWSRPPGRSGAASPVTCTTR